MNIHEIHNLLLAGKVLSMEFCDAKEAESFRVRVAQYKGIQDKQMVAIGLMENGERLRFSFQVQGNLKLLGTEVAPVSVVMQYKDRQVLKQYQVKILEDEGGDDGEKREEV